MDKETKEKIAQKYFRDIKVKYLKDFTSTTPNGNIIRGVICKKANHFLGSMVIEEIYWKEKDLTFSTEQFVQSMPKIHYYDYHHEMYEDKDGVIYPVFEKLDGTCLILYGLYTDDDEVIEIIPKTRGLPVADLHIREMFYELEQANIKSFFENFKKNRPTLLFELFGSLNQHSIFYPQTRIDINLIGATSEGRFFGGNELIWLSKQYDFKCPYKIFDIINVSNEWKIRISPGIFHYYLFNKNSKEEINAILSTKYPTQLDMIQALKEMITTINKNHILEHNRQLLEGGVINAYNSNGNNQMYLKVKSADIEERCRLENGIPRRFILKEVYKYFDEYGLEAKEIYKKDENHVIEYVNRNLLEEFDKEVVEMKKTQKRIKTVFFDVLETKEPPKGLQDICKDLVEKYPDTEVSDLMRLFAQEYPEKKRYAKIAYGIFVKIL